LHILKATLWASITGRAELSDAESSSLGERLDSGGALLGLTYDESLGSP